MKDVTAAIEWPRKTYELHNNHMDSTIWNDFEFRDDDIIIGTYAKSGTTWTQQIVSQLVFNGAEGVNVADISPWMDMRIPAKEMKLAMAKAQTHRRFLKTHLPVDALVFSPKAKYIYIARDGRDVVWSMYNHHSNFVPRTYELLNDTPGLIGPRLGLPPSSIRKYFNDWVDRDGYPFWSFWDNIRTWWEIRHLPNVLLLHFADMKADMEGQIRRIADFLDIRVDEDRWPVILEHCSFDYMKRNASLAAPLGGMCWEGGAETFIHKGTNGRWRDVLTVEESARYEQMAVRQLGPECAHWLIAGSEATPERLAA